MEESSHTGVSKVVVTSELVVHGQPGPAGSPGSAGPQGPAGPAGPAGSPGSVQGRLCRFMS